jgi:RNA polymerase sigma factor (sigma-70 family)
MHAPSRALAMPHLHVEPPRCASATPRAADGGFDTAQTTRAISHGDALAFELLYRAWFERVYSLARALTRRDESFCLDVTQEVMLRAAKRLPELRTNAQLAAWFTRVCTSAACDMLRRESRRKRREQHTTTHNPAPQPSTEELAWLRSHLHALSPDDLTLLLQRIGQGLTLKQAGASIGLGEQAAHGRIRRALHELRQLSKEVWHD